MGSRTDRCDRGSQPARIIASLLLAAALLTGCGQAEESAVVDAASDQAADHRFVIPLGTGEAIARGEQVVILPPELTMSLGQTLELINHDDRGHHMGPFYVGAGETLRQAFSTPGEYQGICTLNPSGEFTLKIG